MNKEKLDQFTLDIEFLLISVVQGIALGALASAASEPLATLNYQYWPYILNGFLLVLVFWSQAIVHSLSFIKWPLDLKHNFFYFALGFIEFLAFAHLEDPLRWFIFQFLFFIVASILYFIDLDLIKKAVINFKTVTQKKLYGHILSEQIKEVKTFLPAGLIFNLIAIYLVWVYPEVFINQGWHVLISLIQSILIIYILRVSLESFRVRSRLISESIK